MKRIGISRWVLVAGLLMAGSCAQAGQPLPASPPAPYDAAAAERTIAFAYGSIVERHLQPVSAASVGLAAMRGLSSLDPSLGVTRLDGRVVLTAAGRTVGEYPAPAENDVAGWAHLSVVVAEAARGPSPMVAAADVEKIYQVMFDATLAKLDRFSRYATAREAAQHRAARNGFGGIGITFDLHDGHPRVTDVLDGTPAAEAGIKVGDVLMRVNGESLDGLDKDGVAARLRGPLDSKVDLALAAAGGRTRQFSLHRTLIVPQTVTSALHDGYAEFKITSFNQRTAANLTSQLQAARRQLGPGIKGVILDLRGNPGGLLDQAVEVADLFIAHGPIVTTRGRHPLASQSYEARPGDLGEDLPVVVLVDGRSASAAEIVTGALEDSGRAVVVGTNSYGKGTVQTVLRLPNDGEMTLTWSRFYTPSGYALHHLGVLPTICTANLSARPDGLIDGVVHASAPGRLPAELAQWRAAPFGDAALRNRLRATCPSARHGNNPLDMEVAEDLLANRAVYRRALALTAPPAAIAAPAAGETAAGLPQQVQH